MDIDSYNIKKSSDVTEFKEIECESIAHGTKKLKKRPVIIGFGPAGMFAGLFLSMYGFEPIILERGQNVDGRVNAINRYWESDELNKESNVQFGEGGAGTFSDGKLTTRISDSRCNDVLKLLVENGAPENILYLSKPHIGTDNLRKVVKNIRKKIESLGGKIYFSSKLTDICVKNNKVSNLKYNKDNEIDTSIIILAIGHSSRDTFELLKSKDIYIEPKSFSVGFRIEHLRDYINNIQFGEYSKYLKSASYQIFHKTDNRTVYTFCMCPGGKVVAAASEENTIVTNGMSYYNRNDINSNSAIVVSVDKNDFLPGALGGLKFQRKYERKAYEITGGAAPVQRLVDFVNDNTTSKFGNVKPSYTGNIQKFNLNNIYSKIINDNLKAGLKNFDTKLKGFYTEDALLTGVETRTSSPVRIVRNENFHSISCENLYPIGEGAGYAGGIMSAAVDGIRIAEKIIKENKPLY